MFYDYWNSKAVIPIHALGRSRGEDLPEFRNTLAGMIADAPARPYLDRVADDESVREMLAGKGQIHWTADARVVSDPPEKVKGAGEESCLMNVTRPLLASARTDLETISPYFIPGEKGTSELVAMAQRGIRVAVLTNSLAATDCSRFTAPTRVTANP